MKCKHDAFDKKLELTEYKLESKDIVLYIYTCKNCNKYYVFWVDEYCEVILGEDKKWYFAE
jgi:hypothetical protein